MMKKEGCLARRVLPLLHKKSSKYFLFLENNKSLNRYCNCFSNLLSREDNQKNLSDTQLYLTVINSHNIFKTQKIVR